MKIGEGESLLSALLANDVSTETENNNNTASEIASENEGASNIGLNEVASSESLLSNLLAQSDDSDAPDFKSQYEEKVASGEWVEVKDAENIEWSEDSFKAIEEAQKKSSTSEENKEESDKSEESKGAISEDVDFRQNRIKALNETDFNDIENAKELMKLYRVQQEGEDKSASIDKQIAALDDEEVIQYAKTISAKIVKEDEAFIKSEKDRVKAAKKAEEENWNKYTDSVVSSGSKFKIPAEKSKEKLEKVKSGEFNKQLWNLISDPEKFHKVFDFIMDMEKYEEKIKAKTNSKLVVEAITKKNINSEVRTPNLGKINIPI